MIVPPAKEVSMKCDPNIMQAYADDALAAADQEALEQHLVSCAACREQVSAICKRHAGVVANLSTLDPLSDEIPDPNRALAGFRIGTPHARPTLTETLRRKAEMIKQTLLTGRWRPVSIGVTAAICLAVLFSFAPVRQAAADFLGIFRVRKFAAIPVDPAQAQRLESLAKSLDEGAFGKPTTVREAGELQPVNDAAQASTVAGFPVRVPSTLPEGASLRSFSTQAGPALHFEIDRPTMQALLNAAGVEGATMPDVELITADVNVPTMVAEEYDLGGNAKLIVVQSRSPEVALPAGVDPTALGQLGLQVLGIPVADAHRIAQEIDWSSTVIVPLPTDIARSTEVTVDGVTGLLLEETRQNRPAKNSVLVWERDGIVYSIDGRNVDPSLLIQVGDSLH
jgi:anti-sigma factor RsiW